LEIKKNILGEDHPDYATSLTSIGSVYNKTKSYDKALEINLKSL